MLGGWLKSTSRAQISCFSPPASTPTATVQDGIGLCTGGEIDTRLGRKSFSLGGGKQASSPCPNGFGRRTPLRSQGSCGLAASDGVRGSSRERISVRQRNHFSHHVPLARQRRQAGEKTGTGVGEQEHPGKHCRGFATIDLWAQAHSNKISPLIAPGAYLYVLAEPFEGGRLAACPIHRYLFPPQVLHHDALSHRGAPVKGRSCQSRLLRQGLSLPFVCLGGSAGGRAEALGCFC